MTIHPWHDLAPGSDPPSHLNVVVEIPRGSRNKYELDKDTGLFRLDRLLYSAVHYPGDYGLIPRTLADDDDPLDVLIMVTEPTFPGCLVSVRPLGVFRMRDDKGLDDKVLAVPVYDPLYDEYHGLEDVPGHYLREVEHFFTIYKELEGARTEIMGWEGRDAACRIIEECRQRYDREFGTTP